MSISLGIIEWVNDTKPLKACLEDSPTYKEQSDGARTSYTTFVSSIGKGSHVSGSGYEPLLEKAPRDKVVKKMEELWMKMSTAHLKVFFLRLAASPDTFVTLRTDFANSLAALNICSYLLGIGDRHLDNFLIDLTSGRIIGIDFGHAFGSATEVLPIPELVPFRLTKQMEKLYEPLKIQAFIEAPMVNVLESLRDNKDVLMNALNIFIKEPLMEWRKYAAKQASRQGRGTQSIQSSNPDSQDHIVPEWYPQKKVEIARRKLEGENPAYITVDELAGGHSKKTFFRHVKSIVEGSRDVNIRANTPKMCPNVKAQ
ncbi:hypothetical protein HK101_006638, partial [Irineochytrium annulatum]